MLLKNRNIFFIYNTVNCAEKIGETSIFNTKLDKYNSVIYGSKSRPIAIHAYFNKRKHVFYNFSETAPKPINKPPANPRLSGHTAF